MKYKDVDLTAQDSVPGRPVFYYDVTAAGTATDPWKAVFALPLEGFDSSVTSTDQQLGVFVQDDWVVNDHLTLNLGIRWDIEWNESYLDFADAAVPAGFAQHRDRAGTHLRPVARPVLRSEYRRRHQRLPRHRQQSRSQEDALPAAARIFVRHRRRSAHVIFGGAGRAYDRTLYDYLQLEQTKFALATSELRFNTRGPSLHARAPRAWPGIRCTRRIPAPSTALFNGMAGEVNLINNDLEVPYSDQFSLGMRNRLGDWNTSVSVSRIVSKEGFVFTLGNRYPNGDFWQNRSQPWGNSPPGPRRRAARRRQRHRDREHAGAARRPTSRSPRNRAGARRSRTRTRTPSTIATSTSTMPSTRRRSTSIHSSCRTPRPSIAWSPPARTRRPGDSCSRASSRGRRPFRAMSPRVSRDRRCSPMARPAPRSRTSSAPATGYKSLDLQITKNFEIGDLGVLVPAIRRTERDQRGQPGRLHRTSTDPNGLIAGGSLQPHRQHHGLSAHACAARSA